LKMKAKVTVYDPKAIENTKKIFGDKISYKNSVLDALNKSQCAIFMTYWKEFEKINNKSMHQMKRKLIIDCRRIFTKGKIGEEYYALGIGK
jgi:UDPglucose 6-dehydrogenase